MKILIVDDDPDMQLILEYFLGGEEREILSAGSISEARSTLRTGQFDVIILDRMLPDGDGLQLLQESPMHTEGTAVLVLTAKKDMVVPDSGSRIAVMQKPFTREDLLRQLEQLTADKNARPE